MKTLNTSEKVQQVSRFLDDELGEMWIQIQALQGAKEFMYDISNELDTLVHRGNASPTERKLNIKINAIYELMNHSLSKVYEHEKEISELSNELFHYFSDNKKESV